MLKRNLIQQLKFAQFTILKNMERVSHEESLKGPEPAGNCANWVLGHIVHTRGAMHALLGKAPAIPPEKTSLYNRGAEALSDGSDAVSVEELLGAYLASQETIVSALEEMNDDGFAAPKPEDWNSPGGDTVGEQISALIFHESYHAGQLGIIRRALGKGDNLT